MSGDEIVFEDPPPLGKRTSQRYEEIRKTLLARPGEWARLPGPFGLGFHASAKRALGEGFEITSRSAPKNEQGRRQIHLWARYIGEPR